MDDGVEITGVAEEKTGGGQRRVTSGPRLKSAEEQRGINRRRCFAPKWKQKQKRQRIMWKDFNSCIIQKEFLFVQFKSD